MNKYVIDYGTGAGNIECDSLEEAKCKAFQNCSYTQEPIKILEDGQVVLISYWRNGTPEQNKETCMARFGDYGYYSDWYYDVFQR